MRAGHVVRGLAVAAAVVIAALVALVAWGIHASLPTVSGTLVVPGLGAPVTVIRDRSGVPHVFAASPADAYRALGVVEAQDRRFIMEIARRAAAGRLAETFGTGPDTPLFVAGFLGRGFVDIDRQIRNLGFVPLARAELELMSAENRALLEAFAGGFNAAADAGAASGLVQILGVPLEPWTPVDSLAARKLGDYLSSFQRFEEVLTAFLVADVGEGRVADFLPPYPADWAPPLVDGPMRAAVPSVVRPLAAGPPPAPIPLRGSNNWVLAGRRTTTGAPILANDPHVEVNPPLVYVAHLSAPGLEVIGTTSLGVGFAQGHNARIAWGITLVGADNQDYFVEELDASDPPRVRTPTGWLPVRQRREEILVRGHAAPVVHVVRTSPHGPLVYDWTSEDVRRAFGDRAPAGARYANALAWTGLTPAPPDALLRVARAHDWESFRDAYRPYGGTVLNMVYADTVGHIGYQMVGHIPVREGPAPLTPVPGWERGHEWVGTVPFDELPRVSNPEEGMIATANARITGPGYPHHIATRWGDVPLRLRRIRELLAARPRHSLDDVAAIQLDVRQERLGELARWAQLAPPTDPQVRSFQKTLATWDLEADPRSMPAALAETFRLELFNAILAPRLSAATLEMYRWTNHGAHLLALERALGDPDAAFFGPDPAAARTARQEAVTLALRRALESLEQAMGPDRAGWRWGRLHTVTFVHPLAEGPLGAWLRPYLTVGPLEAPGSSFTVNAGWWRVAQPFTTWIAPMYRQIVDLGDLGRSRWLPCPPGLSEHPTSRHFGDLAEPWRAGEYRPMLWTRAQVEADAESTLTLVPG